MRRALYGVLIGYLERLPGGDAGRAAAKGEPIRVCVYSPHPLRATTATLLLDARERIATVEDLLDHKHITATQIYDKRRSVRDLASHESADLGASG